MAEGLDIAKNRRASNWTRKELLGRALWEYFGTLVFAAMPRPFWAMRCAILSLFGARIGRNVHLCPSVRIAVPWNLEIGDEVAVGDRVTLYNLGRLAIGPSATISQGAHLCGGTHDFRRTHLPLVKSPITIGAGAWICADAFVGPGVTVGELAVVGARAVVVRNVGPKEIVAGNPARRLGTRDLTEA